MLDIKLLRRDPDYFRDGFRKRNMDIACVDHLIALDTEVRNYQTTLQDYQKQKNSIAQEMAKNPQQSELREQGESVKKNIQETEHILKAKEEELMLSLSSLPNVPDASVPIGKDEKDNQEMRTWGELRLFSFKPKEHFEITMVKPQMDFEKAAEVSGARFVYLKGRIAQLHRALKNLMLDTLTQEFGYTEFDTPYLVNTNAVYGVGQLPKFEEDLFKTTDGRWLISTSEITLTNYVCNSIVKDLPLRFTAATPCFRSEAGASGKDTRGMIRQHQFTKVEMVSICDADASDAEHERMTNAAERILQKLDLPYRVMLLCTGDMGFASQKTYDIEVFLPGQGCYREISSCSNCGDFQARRMKTRVKKDTGNEFVHTLNGSGLAVGRTLIAVLENYQTEDGNVKIPSILRDAMGELLFQ